MQENHPNEFDRLVRSMLTDTEVKPSRRVWKGVSAHLDEAAAASRAWMKWAGMSLAAAAVVAALIVPGGQKDPIPTNPYNQEQALLAQAGDPAGAEAAEADIPAAGLVLPADGDAPAAAHRPAAARTATTEHIFAVPAAQPASDDATQPETAAAQSPSGPPAVPDQEGRQRPVPAAETFSDPFADPLPTGRRTTHPRTSLYAQGTLSSNDSDFRQVIPGAVQMAPGPQSGFTEQGPSTFGIPFTVGLGVRMYLTPRLSLDTGLDYSLLARSFAGSYEGTAGTVTHSLHYLGIPVNFSFDIVSSDKIKFYIFGGGEAEYCLANKYRLLANPDIVRSYPVKGLQFSAGAGLGVEFRIAGPVGFYLDPGIRYYFPANQPRNIRTEKPFLVNFDAGFRFQLGR